MTIIKKILGTKEITHPCGCKDTVLNFRLKRRACQEHSYVPEKGPPLPKVVLKPR